MLALLQGNEIWVVALVVLVLFGGSQLPKLARSVGQAQKEFKKGLDEGRREGLKKGLVEGIMVTCEVLGIELTTARRTRMNELDASGLEALLAQLRAERRFP